MPTIEELQAELTVERAEKERIAGEHAAAQARIKELNTESMGHRLAAKNALTEKETAVSQATTQISEAQAQRDAAIAAQKAAEGKVTEIQTTSTEALTKAQQRVIDTELRAAAREAGAVDPADVLGAIDRSKIKTDDKGEITNVAELIAEVKTAKAHFFSTNRSTSNPKPPPPKPGQNEPKKVAEMTDEEVDQAIKQRAWRGAA